MTHPILEELEKAADEILSKSKQPDELDPDEISEEADEEEDAEDEAEEEADGGSTEDENEDENEDEGEDEDEDDMKKGVDTEPLDPRESEALSAMVEIIAKSLGDVMTEITDVQRINEGSSEVLAKSQLSQRVLLDENAKALEKAAEERSQIAKSLEARLQAIEDKLDEISAQPAHMRKSVAASTQGVVDRNFGASLHGTGGGNKTLSKSEVVGLLNNELASGSPIVRPEDIVAIESGGQMRSEIRALIDSKSAR